MTLRVVGVFDLFSLGKISKTILITVENGQREKRLVSKIHSITKNMAK
jgi:hypothetical protein